MINTSYVLYKADLGNVIRWHALILLYLFIAQGVCKSKHYYQLMIMTFESLILEISKSFSFWASFEENVNN